MTTPTETTRKTVPLDPVPVGPDTYMVYDQTAHQRNIEIVTGRDNAINAADARKAGFKDDRPVYVWRLEGQAVLQPAFKPISEKQPGEANYVEPGIMREGAGDGPDAA